MGTTTSSITVNAVVVTHSRDRRIDGFWATTSVAADLRADVGVRVNEGILGASRYSRLFYGGCTLTKKPFASRTPSFLRNRFHCICSASSSHSSRNGWPIYSWMWIRMNRSRFIINLKRDEKPALGADGGIDRERHRGGRDSDAR